MADIEDTEIGFGAWFGFWAQFVVLGVLAIGGVWFASAGAGAGDYACGLILAVAALGLAFMRLKYRFDGGAADWQGFLFVDRPSHLAIVVPLFALLGLAGLFLAADWNGGSLHDAGIGLFAASGLAVFLSLKRVFDRLDSHR